MSETCLTIRQGQLASPAVAMLRWESGKPKVAILDKAVKGSLRPYLDKTLSKPPFRIRRQQPASGQRVKLIAEEVGPSDSDFLGRWAAKLTFNPLNAHNFIFTVPGPKNPRVRGTRPPPEDLELASNPCELSGTFRCSVIACPCGAQYPFLTLKCPNCGGTDPIGEVWKAHGGAIANALRGYVEQQLVSSSLFRKSLQSVRQSFEEAKAAAASSRLRPTEGDDGATTARKLISYYESVFRPGCLSDRIIADVKTVPGRETPALTASLRSCALGVRRLWNPDSRLAWNPSPSFTRECRAKVCETAKAALRATGHCAQQMVGVAAQFSPFHREFKKRIAESEDTSVNFWKVAWTVFKAVKTVGVSLLVGGAMALLKDKKFQERFERFSGRFDQAVRGCASSEAAIGNALKLNDELLRGIAKGMSFHLVAVLAEDYASATPGDQERIADTILQLVSRPPAKRLPRYARGLEGQRLRESAFALWKPKGARGAGEQGGRKHIVALWVAITVIAVLGVIALLVIFFRR